MPDIKILLEGILHGDDEHRDWLEEAVYAWAEGKDIPTPRTTSQVVLRIYTLNSFREFAFTCSKRGDH